jgi:dTDP-4-dehydrorhamnose 3,5-epimerase
MLDVKTTDIPDIKIIATSRFGDDRGFFTELYSRRDFIAAGITDEFVQDNFSRSKRVGTIRGLHFQTHPNAQAKLVRVSRGAVLDIVVDVRRSSKTFGQHVGVELTAENGLQLYVPVGFAHGFCTLKEDTEVVYKVTSYYSPADDRGIAYDDPDIAIRWPLPRDGATLSKKDSQHPRLRELEPIFG